MGHHGQDPSHSASILTSLQESQGQEDKNGLWTAKRLVRICPCSALCHLTLTWHPVLAQPTARLKRPIRKGQGRCGRNEDNRVARLRAARGKAMKQTAGHRGMCVHVGGGGGARRTACAECTEEPTGSEGTTRVLD